MPKNFLPGGHIREFFAEGRSTTRRISRPFRTATAGGLGSDRAGGHDHDQRFDRAGEGKRAPAVCCGIADGVPAVQRINAVMTVLAWPSADVTKYSYTGDVIY